MICEFRRVGVDLDRAPIASTAGGITWEDFYVWMRSLPTGLGHEGFLERIRTAGPFAGAAVAGLLAADPTYVDPEYASEIAFEEELDRVWPRSERPGSYGFDWGALGKAGALFVLRALPDGAGFDAVVAALNAADRSATGYRSVGEGNAPPGQGA